MASGIASLHIHFVRRAMTAMPASSSAASTSSPCACTILDVSALPSDCRKAILQRLVSELPRVSHLLPYPSQLLHSECKDDSAFSRVTLVDTVAFANLLASQLRAIRTVDTKAVAPPPALAPALNIVHGVLVATGKYFFPPPGSAAAACDSAESASSKHRIPACVDVLPSMSLAVADSYDPGSSAGDSSYVSFAHNLTGPAFSFDDIHRTLLCGGIAFQYFPQSNCGWISYVSVSNPKRDQCVSVQLVHHAVKAMNHLALANGYSQVAGIFSGALSGLSPDPAARSSSITDEAFLGSLGFGFCESLSCTIPSHVIQSYGSHYSSFNQTQFEQFAPSLLSTSHLAHILYLKKSPSHPLSAVSGYRLPFPVKTNEFEAPDTSTVINTSLLTRFLADVLSLCGSAPRSQSDILAKLFPRLPTPHSLQIPLQPLSGQPRPPTACSTPRTLPETAASEPHVVVIGAGVSGMSAAATLLGRHIGLASRSGRPGARPRVTVVEAGDRYGGRVRQTRTLVNRPIDVGAEFCHGETQNRFYDVIQARHWDASLVFHYEEDGPARDRARVFLDGAFYKLHDVEANADLRAAHSILEKMSVFGERLAKQQAQSGAAAAAQPLSSDIEAVARVSLRDYAASQQASVKTMQILDALSTQTAAARWKDHGALETAREDALWPHGRGNYRVDGSNAKLIDYLMDECNGARFCYDWQAKVVSLGSNGAYTILNQHGEAIECSHVIVTAPLTVLRDGDIEFVPDLPPAKKQAINEIGMHGAAKVMLRCSRKFWDEDLGVVFAAGMFLQQVWFNVPRRQCISVDQDDEVVVTGYASGDVALLVHCLSTEEVIRRFISQLDFMFGTLESKHPASSTVVAAEIYQWLDNPFVRGSYSCSSVLGTRESRERLAAPIADCVFFAGEAVCTGPSACIQHAMDSGVAAAERLLSTLSPSSRL